jgi:hypothetical protein
LVLTYSVTPALTDYTRWNVQAGSRMLHEASPAKGSLDNMKEGPGAGKWNRLPRPVRSAIIAGRFRRAGSTGVCHRVVRGGRAGIFCRRCCPLSGRGPAPGPRQTQQQAPADPSASHTCPSAHLVHAAAGSMSPTSKKLHSPFELAQHLNLRPVRIRKPDGPSPYPSFGRGIAAGPAARRSSGRGELLNGPVAADRS